MEIRAAISRANQNSFSVEAVTLDDPQPDEILVRIIGVGLCHTDLFAAQGNIVALPAVLGHEGSGIIEQVGADVKGVNVGDAVVITFSSCGKCRACQAGEPSYCRWLIALNYIGTRANGSHTIRSGNETIAASFFGQSSFATYALTSERNVVKVDADLPLAILGPLGCGIQTGAGAVIRALECRPGSSLLVTGGGSVGLSAVMAAKIQHCAEIIVVEPKEARRQIATDLGATHVIDPFEQPDLAAAVRAIVDEGVDYAIDTTGRRETIQACLTGLAPHGTLGLVGVAPHGVVISAEINGLITFGQTIRGINIGDSDPQNFIPELIALYRAGRFPFDKLIRTYPFEAINQAVDDQHQGLCIKAVLIMDPV
jgi:aryl-alcohol dehydrogenase